MDAQGAVRNGTTSELIQRLRTREIYDPELLREAADELERLSGAMKGAFVIVQDSRMRIKALEEQLGDQLLMRS